MPDTTRHQSGQSSTPRGLPWHRRLAGERAHRRLCLDRRTPCALSTARRTDLGGGVAAAGRRQLGLRAQLQQRGPHRRRRRKWQRRCARHAQPQQRSAAHGAELSAVQEVLQDE